MDDEKSVLIGIQISGEGAQITWYDQSLEEPQTLSLPGEGEDGLISVPADAWKGALRGGRFGMQSLGKFMAKLIGMVPGSPSMDNVRVSVTVPSLTQELGDHIIACLEELGIGRRNLFLQDWRTSFYYYVVSMKKELWNADVAFIRLRNMQMHGSILHIDRTVRPWVVTIQDVATADVSDRARGKRNDEDWDKERDRIFYEFLGKLFERRTVSTSYLYGNYFDRSWAERSFQYLTFRRHAFQGQNLFSKGACYSLLIRMGIRHIPDMLFMGVDMVTHNIGMRLRVKGREQYHMLIPAGVNWYEAHSRIEMIPDGESSITILTTPMEGGETVGRVLRLDHFPDRKNRATRLRMTIYFSSAHRCEIEVEDLGFGGITPSSGRVWKRQVIL